MLSSLHSQPASLFDGRRASLLPAQTNHKRFLAAVIALLVHHAAFAAVEVSQVSAEATDKWEQAYDGAKLSVSVEIDSRQNSTPVQIDPNSGMMQTFKGDGKRLKAAAFFFPWVSNPDSGSEFKVSLIDFGTTAVVKSQQFNAETQTVLSDTFGWGSRPEYQRVVFNFSDKSNVVLKADHYYGIVLEFPNPKGKQIVLRTNVDAYKDGRLTFGTVGNFDAKTPDRDALFAIYTY